MSLLNLENKKIRKIMTNPFWSGSVALLTHTYFPTSPQPRKVFTGFSFSLRMFLKINLKIDCSPLDFKRGENLDGEDEEDEGDEGDELPTGFSTVSSPGTVPWRLLNNSLGVFSFLFSFFFFFSSLFLTQSGYHSVVVKQIPFYI